MTAKEGGSLPGATRRWLEIGAIGSLAGMFAIIPIYSPQGIDFFAVAFFLLGSLLIEQRDIDVAGWTERRPFVFACTAFVLLVPFVGGVCSLNGFKSEIGTGVYMVAAPPALFLAASRARFYLVRPDDVGRLLLAGVFVGLVPATIYGLIVSGAPAERFFLPGQPALNFTAVYLGVVCTITLQLTADLGRRARAIGYVAVLALLFLGLLTASRTFIVTAALGLFFYAISVRRRKVMRREMAVVAGAVAAVLAASLFAFRNGLSRFFEQQPLGFFDGRLRPWADGLELFRRYPLCGIGPHTFMNQQLNPIYAERDHLGISYIPYYGAHSAYLNTLAEGGVILGALLLILIAAAVRGCYVDLKNYPRNQFGWIAACLLATFLIVGLIEDTIIRQLVFPLAIFLGLGMNVTWRRPGLAQTAEPTASQEDS